MPARDAMIASFQARVGKRKPPRNYSQLGPKAGPGGAYFIPGLGDVGRQKNRQAWLRQNPPPDGSRSVRGGGAFAPRKPRRAVRPNPGWLSNARNQRN